MDFKIFRSQTIFSNLRKNFFIGDKLPVKSSTREITAKAPVCAEICADGRFCYTLHSCSEQR
ncbi:MAG: hypothetical protein DBX39_00750 [Bacillota bacterium]|nr:MAG: hypothetical protein DBX39_00750 [Bacillota bacterium]